MSECRDLTESEVAELRAEMKRGAEEYLERCRKALKFAECWLASFDEAPQ